MPRGDGTGPRGAGPGTGRKMGGSGQGRGTGPPDYCICPQCGEKVVHTPGVPCPSLKCKKCGTPLVKG